MSAQETQQQQQDQQEQDQQQQDQDQQQDQIVTPWDTKCGERGFQYDRLIQQFGVQKIDQELIDRFEKVTGHSVHPWIRRGIFFAHRQLNEILDDHEAGKPIFIYTGRGPTSDALHLGHMIPFIFTKWLQDVFNAVVVIQMADDEKYYFKDMDFDKIYQLGFENAKDIIACGFNPNRTFIFSNRDYDVTPCAHTLIHDMFKKVRVKDLMSVFGLTPEGNIGQFVWPIYQSCAAFSRFFEPIFGANTKIRCLVAYAIDQDPYFRVARDVAESLDSYKPCAIMTQFLPALEGKAKMSSTGENQRTIFMTDDPASVAEIVKKHAFSGGRETLKEHRELGADLEVDMSYQYLRYFEFDDDKLQMVKDAYGSGKMLTSEIKKILTDKIVEIIKEHQVKREAVTEEDIKKFYDITKFF